MAPRRTRPGATTWQARTGHRRGGILLLLSRLGLCAGEVAALQMEDIDWQCGGITLQGKANRHERLPLPADVGEAIVAYLSGCRPTRATGREVFVRIRARTGR